MPVDPHYELLEPLGEGAFGSVRRGVHRPTGLPVAVKLLRRAEPDAHRMLLDEASALAKVVHPNVARLYDVGRTPEGLGYLVMELVRGHDFELWLGAWPGWEPVANALLETLDGLAAAHALGVVHRDLKPANMLLDERDGALRLVDFGVARIVDPLESDEERPIAGTPEFMAPEQLAGGALGPAVDLYAFGVLLHHVLRGVSPYPDELPLPVLLAEKTTRVPRGPQPARPGLMVPRELDALVDALLMPTPDARPRFAAEVRRTLEALVPRVSEVGRPRSRPLPSSGRVEAPAQATLIGTELEAERLTSSQEDTAVGRRAATPFELPAPLDPRRAPSLVPLRDVRLVGREPEQASLRSMIDAVRSDGRPRLLFVLGEPGIGKSRLARWGLSEVERLGLMQGAAAGWEIGGAGIGGGLRHLLARLAGVPEPRERAPYRWLLARDPGIDVELLRAMTLPQREAAQPAMGAAMELARRVLAAVARDAPLYLWLDDVGWARDGTPELLARLLEDEALPALIVATMRTSTYAHPDVQARLGPAIEHPGTRSITLAPLEVAARTALLEEVAPLAPELATQLAAALDGTPVLLVQLLQDWLESGRLVPGPDGLELRVDHTLGSMLAEWPPTRSLDARVERFLESFGARVADAEGVLLRAALLGGAFELGTLLSTCPPAAQALAPEVVDRAILAGVLRAEGGRLSIEPELVRENLLSRLGARADERAILLDTVNGLQARFGKDRADVARAVALLCRRAGQPERAWDRLFHAISRSGWTGDVATARSLLELARAWQEEDRRAGRPDVEAALELARASTAYMASQYTVAEEHLARARARLGPGDEVLALRIESLAADVAFYDGRYADAERQAEGVLRAARESVDPDVQLVAASAAFRLSDVAIVRGDLATALRWRLDSREHAVQSASVARQRLALLGLAEIGVALGDGDATRRWLVQAAQDAERAGDSDHLHLAREIEAFLELSEGRAEPARQYLAERHRAAAALGEPWRVTAMSIGLALAAAIDGSEVAATRVAEEMLAAFDRVPHDGPMELAALDRLEARLRGRGLVALADQVARRRAARRELAARSLAS